MEHGFFVPDTVIVPMGYCAARREVKDCFDPLRDDHWRLNRFQSTSELRLIRSHMLGSMLLAHALGNAVVVAVGGYTDELSDDCSEGWSYFKLGMRYLELPEFVTMRNMRERMSYSDLSYSSSENVVDACAHYSSLFLKYPKQIVLWNYPFKTNRMKAYLHHKDELACRTYLVGDDDPPLDENAQVTEERLIACIESGDPYFQYGSEGDKLRSRNYAGKRTVLGSLPAFEFGMRNAPKCDEKFGAVLREAIEKVQARAAGWASEIVVSESLRVLMPRFERLRVLVEP